MGILLGLLPRLQIETFHTNVPVKFSPHLDLVGQISL